MSTTHWPRLPLPLSQQHMNNFPQHNFSVSSAVRVRKKKVFFKLISKKIFVLPKVLPHFWDNLSTRHKNGKSHQTRERGDKFRAKPFSNSHPVRGLRSSKVAKVAFNETKKENCRIYLSKPFSSTSCCCCCLCLGCLFCFYLKEGNFTDCCYLRWGKGGKISVLRRCFKWDGKMAMENV